MGYIKHHAIVLTSWDGDVLERAREKAVALGCNVSEVVNSHMNGYGSLLIAPDGSKEGWDGSIEGDARREELKRLLRTFQYEDGSSSAEWAEIAYGSDDREAEISDSEWHDVPVPGRDR